MDEEPLPPWAADSPPAAAPVPSPAPASFTQRIKLAGRKDLDPPEIVVSAPAGADHSRQGAPSKASVVRPGQRCGACGLGVLTTTGPTRLECTDCGAGVDVRPPPLGPKLVARNDRRNTAGRDGQWSRHGWDGVRGRSRRWREGWPRDVTVPSPGWVARGRPWRQAGAITVNKRWRDLHGHREQLVDGLVLAGYYQRRNWGRASIGIRRAGSAEMRDLRYTSGPAEGLAAIDAWEQARRIASCGGDWYLQLRMHAGGELGALPLPRMCRQTHSCPVCASARSRKIATAIREDVRARLPRTVRGHGPIAPDGSLPLVDLPDEVGNLALVTLTQPAVAGESLHDAMLRLKTAWQLMTRGRDGRRWFNGRGRMVKGWFRGEEATRGKEGRNCELGKWWHVHYHVLVETSGKREADELLALQRWWMGAWERATVAAGRFVAVRNFLLDHAQDLAWHLAPMESLAFGELDVDEEVDEFDPTSPELVQWLLEVRRRRALWSLAKVGKAPGRPPRGEGNRAERARALDWVLTHLDSLAKELRDDCEWTPDLAWNPAAGMHQQAEETVYSAIAGGREVRPAEDLVGAMRRRAAGDVQGPWWKWIDETDLEEVYQAAKYPTPVVDLHAQMLAEFLSAAYRRRWHQGGGDWRSVVTRAQEEDVEQPDEDLPAAGVGVSGCAPQECPHLDSIAPGHGLLTDTRSRVEQLLDANRAGERDRRRRAGDEPLPGDERQLDLFEAADGGEPERPDDLTRFRLLDTPEAMEAAAWFLDRGGTISTEERRQPGRVRSPEGELTVCDARGDPLGVLRGVEFDSWIREEDPPEVITWLWVPRGLVRECMRTTQRHMQKEAARCDT